MKTYLKILLVLTLTYSTIAQTQDYRNKDLSIEKRVVDLISKMTIEEKIDLLGGTGFATKPNPRLGIPEMKMADGPVGVRKDKATSFPSGISMGATWNPSLIFKLGMTLGAETKAKGCDVILGPCVNIARIPQGGRNFESFGEDPFLTSVIAVDYIKGVQKTGAIATVKHFASNNQEHQRDYVDVRISERALNEIYFPAFKASVLQADVMTFMSAYNKVNGHYASENDYLLINKLKKEWGFNGLVMSDWGAVHSTIPTFNSGLDLEMPNGKFLNKETLLGLITSGVLKESVLDEKVSRILYVMFKSGLFDKISIENASFVNSMEHKKIAYEVAKESIVLLKNQNEILPLNKNYKKIAVIGPNADVARTGGGGSSMVTPYNSISILKGLKDKNKNIEFIYAKGVNLDGDVLPIDETFFFIEGTNEHGLKAEYFNNMSFEGLPIIKRVDKKIYFKWGGGSPDKLLNIDSISVRWTGEIEAPESGEYTIETGSDDGTRFYFENKLVVDDWNDHAVESKSFKVSLEKGKRYKIKYEYYERTGDAAVMMGWNLPGEDKFKEAISLANKTDAVILCVGTAAQYESEGRDRTDLILPNYQDSLILEVSKANKNVIVVLSTGSPVLMDKWIDHVDAVLEVWFGGEEVGNATADVLYGNYNPSGKLPITFPRRWEDCSAFNTYMKQDSVTVYADDIYVGYRHFEKNNVTPLFPFGYGLSYTKFAYSDIKLSSKIISNNNTIVVSANIKNVGSVDGSEIVQLYIKDLESSIDRPEKELKGFVKVDLKKDESKRIEFTIVPEMLMYYDPEVNGWKAEPGQFSALISSSSNDIKLKEYFSLK